MEGGRGRGREGEKDEGRKNNKESSREGRWKVKGGRGEEGGVTLHNNPHMQRE